MANISISDRTEIKALKGAITKRLEAASTDVDMGDCVYIDSNDRAEVATAEGTTAESRARGVVTQVAEQAESDVQQVYEPVEVTFFGPVSGFSLSSHTPGTPLYLGTDGVIRTDSGTNNWGVGWVYDSSTIFFNFLGDAAPSS